MGLARPEMVRPTTVQEAVRALRERGAVALAGATDLMPAMMRGVKRPRRLVNLKGIGELAGVRRERGGVRIGALTRVADLLESTALAKDWPVLVEVARGFGSAQIRNLATIGGNLCSAVPSADFPLPLLALEARLEIAGPRGRRELALSEFFLGNEKTALKAGEVLAAIIVPRPAKRSGAACLKLGVRRAMDLALVGAAAMVALGPDGRRCRKARIGLGAVAPVPMRATAAEGLLEGKQLTDALIAQAAEAAAGEARPVSDHRASAGYRREMVEVLTRRAVREAWRRAREGGSR